MTHLFIYPILFQWTTLSASFYHPVKEQCQGDPLMTASGWRIDTTDMQPWIAMSRDIIWCEYRQKLTKDTTVWRGDYAWGDTLTLWTFQGVEKWVVRDCMAARFKQKIDFLQPIGQRKEGKFALILE